MSEYIERKAALAETRKPRLTDSELRRRLASIPAADVVEVVRCRDCRYWAANDPEDGWGWCHSAIAGEYERNQRFYCFCGWRKEEDK